MPVPHCCRILPIAGRDGSGKGRQVDVGRVDPECGRVAPDPNQGEWGNRPRSEAAGEGENGPDLKCKGGGGGGRAGHGPLPPHFILDSQLGRNK